MIRRSDFLYGLSAAGVLGLDGANPPAGKPEKPTLKIGLAVQATSFLPVYVAPQRRGRHRASTSSC